MFVVFDLDGTIALTAHRQHFLDRATKDWDAFFAACIYDPPCEPVIAALRAHLLIHRVEIWSGRSEAVRPQTEVWLASHGVPTACLQRMRSADDRRPDVVVKREWLREARANGGAPDVVYDDRDVVVAMWREEGVPCFQVAPGPF